MNFFICNALKKYWEQLFCKTPLCDNFWASGDSYSFQERILARVFPMDFVKLLRTPFLGIASGWLLLSFVEVWPNVGLDAMVLQFLKDSWSVFFKGLRVSVWAVGVCYAILLVLHWVGMGHWPSEVYPAGKLQWHFTCGFDFMIFDDCHLRPLLQSWRG